MRHPVPPDTPAALVTPDLTQRPIRFASPRCTPHPQDVTGSGHIRSAAFSPALSNATGASLRQALQALKHQSEAERDAEINYVDPRSRLLELRPDVAPYWTIAVMFRQVLHQNTHVGERREVSLLSG